MKFRVETGLRTVAGQTHTVFTLSDPEGANRAEVWPSFGCNCMRWSVAGRSGLLELLYVAPDWESNPVPTRSGNPALFPFPNRIRDGRFTWDGREFQLPINGPNGQHAIHGFVCRKPWRVMESGGTEDRAWLTAQFQGSIDAPESLEFWPADYRISLTVELAKNQLLIVAQIENSDIMPLPFGLGYHPYFAVSQAGDCTVSSSAGAMWELVENIPTCRLVPPNPDLRTPTRLSNLQLDDIYTGFGHQISLYRQGQVEFPGVGMVEVWVSPGFREMVAFTPPHRNAVCLEPYTCTTDAINLYARGIDAGLRILQPGQTTTETVRFQFQPDFTGIPPK